MELLKPGLLLISDPFLKDKNFIRTVILICDHQTDGSVGFVINKTYDYNIGYLVSGLEDCNFPVYVGGPVQVDTIHFLHQRPDLIEGGYAVSNNIYWGGNFEQVKILLQEKKLTQKDIKFFIGYSGWDAEQLAEEIKEKSWITRTANKQLVFNKNTDILWKQALQGLGGEYELMANYPLDPQYN
ncbi:MAG: YqgE/AlgH family protein [Bacteroidetes bacterium]|nr:YqgE/AlgH family protein [Bacteroidota bacterium]MBS1648656.1 YqgE/AlgH family protein [Bacteroidota bacterium]